MEKILSNNPSTGEVLGEVDVHTTQDIENIVQTSRRAQKSWSKLSLLERIDFLKASYDTFQKHTDEIALLLSREMWMPITQAMEEVKFWYMYWEWYLQNAEKYLSPEITKETETEIHTVFYEPKWVVAAIAPWNYPFSMSVWACMQALLAGNTVIFKTSKETILTGKKIEEIFSQSWLPHWVFQEVYGSGSVGDVLVHQDIDFITFTGSTKVGKWLYKIAAEKFIGCVMELWGSAPWIVCEDADIDKILDTIYFFRFSNCGQMCDGLKRLIVHESRYDEIIARLKKTLELKRIGVAEEMDTDIGPLVSESQLVHLEQQVQDALDLGADIIYENIPDENLSGSFHSAMILWNVSPQMLVWKEEVFWPVLPVVTYSTFDQMIELANDTEYGLWAYVFTKDKENFYNIAKLLKTGEVQHNNMNYCIGENPFWGYKNSGLGREHWHWGFHEFCNVKVVSVEK